MRVGTCHFVSRESACDYYAKQGLDCYDVAVKLEAGEIHIGPPSRKPGEVISVIPGEGRYQVESLPVEQWTDNDLLAELRS